VRHGAGRWVALAAGVSIALAFAGPAAWGAESSPLRIGLFVPGGGEAPAAGGPASLGMEVRRGAEIAIRSANRERGVRGRTLALVTTPSDLPWGSAAPALVKMMQEDHPAAILGALDARTAHLAEQIVTRARGTSIFVTTWATESTLTRINVPWFFRIVPDDDLQARRLAGEIFTARGIRRAAAWVGDGPDAASAAQAFLRSAPPDSVDVFGTGAGGGKPGFLAAISRGEPGGVVLFASPREASEILPGIRSRRAELPIFGVLSLATPGFLEDPGGVAEGIVLAAPPSGTGSACDRFEAEYRRSFGAAPTPAALYAHDATAAVIEALRRSASDSGDALAAALTDVRIDGATGEVRFDEQRSRDADPDLSIVRSGRLVSLREGATAPGSPRGAR